MTAMKTTYLYSAAIALALMATGCNDDLAGRADEQPVANGRLVRVGASMDAQTRLGITNTGTQLVYTWEDDDAFRVFDLTQNQHTLFSIDPTEGVGTAQALFSGTPDYEYAVDEPLYAVYHRFSFDFQPDENGNVTLDISGQTGELTDKYQYMFGEATYSETETTCFTFHHLVTMLKLNITVPEGVTALSEVNFKSNELPTKATLVLRGAPDDACGLFKAGDVVSCYNTREPAEAPLTINGNFEAKDGVVTVYLYVLPAKQYNANFDWYNSLYIEPSIWVKDNGGNEYVATAAFAGKDMVAGKTYELDTELYALKDFANQATATGQEDDPYQIANTDQFYSFMKRATMGQTNAYNVGYAQCSYVLTDDIVLNNEMIWKPVTYYDGTFDGNGHSITGNITIQSQFWTGLFAEILDATVRNIVLDFSNVTFTTEQNNEYFGTLAGHTVDTSLINCINHSDISGAFYQMGGLIGEFGVRSSMMACGNTGNLSTLRTGRRIGGIAAITYNDGSMNACYNTGNLYINESYWEGVNAGGIAGAMQYAPKFTLKNCWSNTSLTINNVIYDDHYVDNNNNIFMGGIVGHQDAGQVIDCYWNEGVGPMVGYQAEGAVATGGGTFAGTIPDAAQFDVLNAGAVLVGWEFKKEDGTLQQNNSTIVPSLPKEDW